MELFYLIILGFLALLAIFDLFIGVSNDAVNFLNSAIGSRIAPFRIILAVASLGVLTGTTFSSGMMEIARSGIINPQMFTFSEIMIIFFAVMVTDVFMLDRFNSLGLPTSTTVSIIFDLLGGAFAAAAIKLWRQSGSFGAIVDYINNEKALAIVFGILISVVVAFIAGTVVQYIARLIFTFDYERVYRFIGGAFGGLAITAIIYFLVMKGAKGASFMKPEYLQWIDANTKSILLWLFVGSSIVLQSMILLFRTNIFKIVILLGTFSLAFAFAGNDLVNFVGVPLAAYDSFLIYQKSGLAPDVLTMESLKQATQTPTFLLLLSGLIMVLALWFSKKAQKVVQTSINLSSQDAADQEQFGASRPARVIVYTALKAGKVLHYILPPSLFSLIDERMEKKKPKKGEVSLPFDHIRASINLVVASSLIASATALKLPLSTTYVTFMVAMGSSFADGAWDRESAVYRISGVLTVIAGWFITAFFAFTMSAINTSLVFVGGGYAVFGLMIVTTAIILHSNFFSKEKKDDDDDEPVSESDFDANKIRDRIHQAVAKNLKATLSLYKQGIEAFLDEDVSKLKKIRNDAGSLLDNIVKKRKEYYRMAQHGNEDRTYSNVRHLYYRSFTNMKDVAEALRRLMTTARDHVSNHHRVYKGVLRDNLIQLTHILEIMKVVLEKYPAMEKMTDLEFTERSNECLIHISRLQMDLLREVECEELSLRGSELYLSFLQFARDAVTRYTTVALLQRELNITCQVGDPLQVQLEAMRAKEAAAKAKYAEVKVETKSEKQQTHAKPKMVDIEPKDPAKKAAVEAKVTEAVDKLKTVLQAKAVDSVPDMTVSSMPSQEAEIETENQHQDFLDSEVEAKKSDVKKEPGDTETKHKGSSKQKKN